MNASPALRAARHAWRAVIAAGATLLAAMPVWAYLASEPTMAARGAVAAMAAAAALSPASALLACVGLVPLSGPIAALLGVQTPGSFGEPLVLAFLAGCGLRLVAATARSAGSRDPRLASSAVRAAILPAAVLAVVSAASAAVELFAIQPAVADPWPFAAAAARYLYTDFFRDRATFDPIVSAVIVIAWLGLYAAAAVLVARDQRLAGRVLSMAACGAAGVAALNVVRLVTVWQREGGAARSLVSQWGSLRASAAFGDPNAAGSYLAMALLIAIGLALAAGRPADAADGRAGRERAGTWWLPIIPLVAIGLWLTGSRAALLTVAAAAVVLLPAALRASKRVVLGAAALIVVVIAIAVPFAMERFNPPETSARSLQQSFDFRVEMTRAAGRMIADHPVFGVGLGRFHAQSGAYIAEAVRVFVPRENAHNNFLQVLAELGIVGFVPFLALLAVPARRVARGIREGDRPPAGLGAAAGLLAFVLTWLSGHPLLIFEVSSPFWIVLGTVAAMFGLPGRGAKGPSSARRPAVGAWLAAGLAAAVVVSVPFRGWAAKPLASVQNTVIGLSPWETDDRGELFRNVDGASGQFYVPADATSVRLPIRQSPGAGPGDWMDVEVSLEGVLVSRLRVEGPAWRDAAIVLPKTAARRPFRTVQVTIVDASRATAQSSLRLQLGAPLVTQPGEPERR